MVDPKIFDDLAHRLADAVPGSVRAIQHDLEKNFRAALQSAFAKLDLVTREEFEVQSAVLARSRAKVEALEERVVELERDVLGGKGPTSRSE
jgi:BMFP domain-containing protein YqiC